MNEWRVIPSFPDYEASDAGEIRRVRPGGRQKTVRPLSPHVERNGYVTVTLWVDGRTNSQWVQRLVCEAFNGPAPAGLHAAHDNGIRTDNRPSNLVWKTRFGNMADKQRHGTENTGSRNGMSVLTEEQVCEIRARVATLPRSSGGKRIKKGVLDPLAREFGVSAQCLRQIVRGDNWRHTA